GVWSFFSWSVDHGDLPSFPTRRSSDLDRTSGRSGEAWAAEGTVVTGPGYDAAPGTSPFRWHAVRDATRRPPPRACQPDDAGASLAGPPAVDQDRRVRRPDVTAVGRGPDRPAQPPPRRRHGLPDAASHRRRHVRGGEDLRPRPARRRRGRPRGRPRQAGLLPEERLAVPARPGDPRRGARGAPRPDRAAQAGA